jgi:hypothetical protein
MAAVLDLNNILEQIQTIFESANTTTASPVDISNGLSTQSGRVRQVYKTHPTRIRPEVNVMPFVTTYISSKSTDDQTFARDKLSIKRKADVTIDVVGAVWNTAFQSADTDPADADIHVLMENLELCLRGNDTLNGAVHSHVPTGVEYYDENLDEGVHLRFGILTLRATAYY